MAGITTQNGIDQRLSMGHTKFQIVAAKTKQKTVEKKLQIFTQLYVKLLPCNLFNLFWLSLFPAPLAFFPHFHFYCQTCLY